MNDSGLIRGNVAVDYPDYLRDESRCVGTADSVSFPLSEEELLEVLVSCSKEQLPITTQGARTGITGGAVPSGGHIVNLSRMNSIVGIVRKNDSVELMVQPGVLLTEIGDYLSSETGRSLWFPPDPTETSASIGGMVSCNASGARSLLYGPTRDYVSRVRVVLVSGDVLELSRGVTNADGRNFTVKSESGKVFAGALPSYSSPDIKSAAGYFVKEGMDLIDLFIGAEGTLGIITEIDLRLVPRPSFIWGATLFLPDSGKIVECVAGLRNLAARPAALEFFDERALSLLREQKRGNPAFKDIPETQEKWEAALYLEYHGETESEVEQAVISAAEYSSQFGVSDDDAWLATGDADMLKLKLFRHAVPEAVNLTIDERRKSEPGLTKLGTDLAVPDGALSEILELYNKELSRVGLEYVIFGHIGNNHVHVNILPRDMGEYSKGKDLYLDWARKAVAVGGTVSAEHGIGKLKKEMLLLQYGQDGVDAMRAVKMVFDPDERLNRGNLFSTTVNGPQTTNSLNLEPRTWRRSDP